jgi:hypothetical protein
VKLSNVLFVKNILLFKMIMAHVWVLIVKNVGNGMTELHSNQRVMSLLNKIDELTPEIVFCLGSMNTTNKWYKELDEICKPMIHALATLRRKQNAE